MRWAWDDAAISPRARTLVYRLIAPRDTIFDFLTLWNIGPSMDCVVRGAPFRSALRLCSPRANVLRSKQQSSVL